MGIFHTTEPHAQYVGAERVGWKGPFPAVAWAGLWSVGKQLYCTSVVLLGIFLCCLIVIVHIINCNNNNFNY